MSQQLPTAPTAEAVMLLMAESQRRIHTRPDFEKRYWVQTCYSRGRGWWSILWMWPEHIALSGNDLPYRQFDAGKTLPIYCETEKEAVDWAWTLADEPSGKRKRPLSLKRIRKIVDENIEAAKEAVQS